MEWCEGDIIDIARVKRANVIAFTANNVITNSGKLVMGAGAALAVRNSFHGCDTDLGAHLKAEGSLGDYHLAVVPCPNKGCALVNIKYIAAVQVKRDFNSSGILDLTKHSLELFATFMNKNPELEAVLNCPLIGLGGFKHQTGMIMAMVEDILKETKVTVCKL